MSRQTITDNNRIQIALPRQSQRIANRSQNQTTTTTTSTSHPITTTTTTTTTSTTTPQQQQAIDRKEIKEKRGRKPTNNNNNDNNKENTNTNNNNNPATPTTQQTDPCGICFEPPEVKGKIDSCEHPFCFECINTWAKKENSCPLCKSRFHSITKIHLNQPTAGKRKRSSVVSVRNRNQQPVFANVPWQNFIADDGDESDDSDFEELFDTFHFTLPFQFPEVPLPEFSGDFPHIPHFPQFSNFNNQFREHFDDFVSHFEPDEMERFNYFVQRITHGIGANHEDDDSDDDDDDDDDEESDDSDITEIEQIIIDDTPSQTYNIERDEYGRELILIDDLDDGIVANSRQTRLRRI